MAYVSLGRRQFRRLIQHTQQGIKILESGIDNGFRFVEVVSRRRNNQEL